MFGSLKAGDEAVDKGKFTRLKLVNHGALLELILGLILADMGQEALTNLFSCLAVLNPEMKQLIRANSHC